MGCDLCYDYYGPETNFMMNSEVCAPTCNDGYYFNVTAPNVFTGCNAINYVDCDDNVQTQKGCVKCALWRNGTTTCEGGCKANYI